MPFLLSFICTYQWHIPTCNDDIYARERRRDERHSQSWLGHIQTFEWAPQNRNLAIEFDRESTISTEMNDREFPDVTIEIKNHRWSWLAIQRCREERMRRSVGLGSSLNSRTVFDSFWLAPMNPILKGSVLNYPFPMQRSHSEIQISPPEEDPHQRISG